MMNMLKWNKIYQDLKGSSFENIENNTILSTWASER